MASQADFEAKLVQFRESLDEAWSQRSAAEREARSLQRAAIAEPPPAATLDIIKVERARQRAALSGWVDPLDLLSGLDVDNPHALLDTIAAAFDRSNSRSGWLWQMRAGPRASIYRGLVETGETAFEASLADAIADAGEVPTDQAGDRLREIIAEGGIGDPEVAAAVDRPQLEATLQALGWARIAADQGAFDPEPVVAARDAVRRALSTQICTSNCDRLLAAGFYGYERQLKRLRAFATAQFEDDRVPVLPIEGEGGAGKSTLLAKLMRGELDADPGEGERTIVVQLDFDRLLFRNGGELERSFEVARQIGVQVPAVDAGLRELSDAILERRTALSEDMKQETGQLESLRRATDSFDDDAGRMLRSENVDKRPVLLLLDTFEEWRHRAKGQPPAQLQRLVEWLSTLKHRMGLGGLRVVISGRVTFEKFGSSLKVQRKMQLKGIDRAKARGLLKALKVAPAETDRLLELIGGSHARRRWIPLTLHIAARLMNRLEPEQRVAFLAGDSIDAEIEEGLRQGTLYGRYLEHMEKGDVRKVALPGLALRRVTVPIIQHVLAGPCKLGKVSEARAQDLFAQLEREVWLVDLDRNALVHRPDVRSVMVRMMAADPKVKKQVKSLHRAALRWYRNGDGRTELGEERARQEALYHELALLPADSDLPQLVKGVPEKGSRLLTDLRALLPASNDFGPRLAAQLRFAAEDWVPPEEARHLPDSLRADYVREHGQRLVRKGEATAAVRFFVENEGMEPHWLAQAQVDAVRWRADEIAMDGVYVEELCNKPERAMNVQLRHHILREFLAGEQVGLEKIASLVERGAEASLKTAPRASSSIIVDTIYFLLVAFGPDELRRRLPVLPRFLVTLARQGRGGRRTFEDWLRAALVARAFQLDEESAEALYDTSASVVVAGMLRPNPRLVEMYRAYLDSRGSTTATAAVAQYGERLMGSGSTTDMLFGWPAEATKRLKEMESDGVTGPVLCRLPLASPLLRIGDPELRPAIRLAIGHAFAEEAAFRRLGDILSHVLPVTATDLTSLQFATGWKAKGQTLVRLVEFLDRADVMAPALEALCAAAPGDPMLAMVRDGHRRWDDSSRAMLSRLVGDTTNA